MIRMFGLLVGMTAFGNGSQRGDPSGIMRGVFLTRPIVAADLADAGHVRHDPVAAYALVEFTAQCGVRGVGGEIDSLVGVVFEVVELMRITLAVDVLQLADANHAFSCTVLVELAEDFGVNADVLT